MPALFRNPLLRLLVRLWWLPVLAPTAAWGAWAAPGLRLAGFGARAYLAAVAGIVLAAWAHGACAALRECVRHGRARHRFLCPDCLHFGRFDFACGVCGQEVEAFLVHTHGAYVSDCSRCHAPLLSREGRDGWRVRAYCRHCERHCDRSLYHERQVRAVAALLPADFAMLCETIGTPPRRSQRVGTCCCDEGERLTYVLKLGDLTDTARTLPLTHALRAVAAIWLDMAGVEPLALGQAADRFIRQARLTEARRRALTICVRQDRLEPIAQNVLAARFGTIQYGVAPATFLGQGARPGAAPALPQHPAPPPIVPAASRATRTLLGTLAGFPLLQWGQRLNGDRLDAFEWWCSRTLGPLLLLRAVWLSFSLFPLGDGIPTLQIAAYVALIAAVVAPGSFRSQWRAVLHSAAAAVALGILASAP